MVTGNDVPACGRMMVVAPVPPKVPICNITDIRIPRPFLFLIIKTGLPSENWKSFSTYLLLETLSPFLC